MSALNVSYHDHLDEVPAQISIQHQKPHDGVQAPYYRLQFGYNLIIYISPERLCELGAAIAAAFPADIALNQIMPDRSGSEVDAEFVAPAAEAEALLNRGVRVVA